MTVVYLNPDTTTTNTGTVTGGGGDADAVMRDSSDSTYITLNPGEVVDFTVDDLSLPAGAIPVAAQGAYRLKTVFAYGRTRRATLLATIGSGSNLWNQTVDVNWSTPTGIVAAGVAFPTDSQIDVAWMKAANSGSSGDLIVYECSIRVVYLIKPVVTVTSPTATLTEDNSPTVTWTTVWDTDFTPANGVYRVKVFSAAEYGAGGFDPETSTATLDSGVQTLGTSTAQTHNFSTPLANGTYRAYVKVSAFTDAPDVQWSAWDYEGFVVDVPAPGVPSVVVTPDDENGRIKLDIDSTTGDASTDAFVIEAERAEGWVPIRTVEGDGRISDDPAEVWDYEAENGVATTYRVRAVHSYTDADAYSDWETQAGYLSGDWWLKHPTIPYYNVQVTLRSFVGYSRAGRQSIQQPLGRTDAVVISDARGAETGEITFRCRDDETMLKIRRLASETVPLWLQAKAGDHERSRWIILGDEQITRLIDHSWSAERDATYTWTEVVRPAGNLVSWTYPEPEPIVLI